MQQNDNYELDPNFGVICSFLDRFVKHLNTDFKECSIDNFKLFLEAKKVHPDDCFVKLHIKLLSGIGNTVKNKEWIKALIKFCKDFPDGDDKLLREVKYENIPIATKLRIFKNLCEDQFEYNDRFNRRVNEEIDDGKDIRHQPIGKDKLGRSYWYFFDQDLCLRIYRGWRNDLTCDQTWNVVCRNSNELKEFIETLETSDDCTQSDPHTSRSDNFSPVKNVSPAELANTEDVANTMLFSTIFNSPVYFKSPKRRTKNQILLEERKHNLKHCYVRLKQLEKRTFEKYKRKMKHIKRKSEEKNDDVMLGESEDIEVEADGKENNNATKNKGNIIEIKDSITDHVEIQHENSHNQPDLGAEYDTGAVESESRKNTYLCNVEVNDNCVLQVSGGPVNEKEINTNQDEKTATSDTDSDCSVTHFVKDKHSLTKSQTISVESPKHSCTENGATDLETPRSSSEERQLKDFDTSNSFSNEKSAIFCSQACSHQQDASFTVSQKSLKLTKECSSNVSAMDETGDTEREKIIEKTAVIHTNTNCVDSEISKCLNGIESGIKNELDVDQVKNKVLGSQGKFQKMCSDKRVIDSEELDSKMPKSSIDADSKAINDALKDLLKLEEIINQGSPVVKTEYDEMKSSLETDPVSSFPSLISDGVAKNQMTSVEKVKVSVPIDHKEKDTKETHSDSDNNGTKETIIEALKGASKILEELETLTNEFKDTKPKLEKVKSRAIQIKSGNEASTNFHEDMVDEVKKESNIVDTHSSSCSDAYKIRTNIHAVCNRKIKTENVSDDETKTEPLPSLSEALHGTVSAYLRNISNENLNASTAPVIKVEKINKPTDMSAPSNKGYAEIDSSFETGSDRLGKKSMSMVVDGQEIRVEIAQVDGESSLSDVISESDEDKKEVKDSSNQSGTKEITHSSQSDKSVQKSKTSTLPQSTKNLALKALLTKHGQKQAIMTSNQLGIKASAILPIVNPSVSTIHGNAGALIMKNNENNIVLGNLKTNPMQTSNRSPQLIFPKTVMLGMNNTLISQPVKYVTVVIGKDGKHYDKETGKLFTYPEKQSCVLLGNDGIQYTNEGQTVNIPGLNNTVKQSNIAVKPPGLAQLTGNPFIVDGKIFSQNTFGQPLIGHKNEVRVLNNPVIPLNSQLKIIYPALTKQQQQHQQQQQQDKKNLSLVTSKIKKPKGKRKSKKNVWDDDRSSDSSFERLIMDSDSDSVSEVSDPGYDYDKISQRVKAAKGKKVPPVRRLSVEQSAGNDLEIESDTETCPVKLGRNARRSAAWKKISYTEPAILIISEDESCDTEDQVDDTPCLVCKRSHLPTTILLCDDCDASYHTACLSPPLSLVPLGDWYCPVCEHNKLIESLKQKYQLVKKALQRRNQKNSRLTNEMFAINSENIVQARSTRMRKAVSYNEEKFDKMVFNAVKEFNDELKKQKPKCSLPSSSPSDNESETETEIPSKSNNRTKEISSKPLNPKQRGQKRGKSRKNGNQNKNKSKVSSDDGVKTTEGQRRSGRFTEKPSGPTRRKRCRLTDMSFENSFNESGSDYKCSEHSSLSDDGGNPESEEETKEDDDQIYYTSSGRKTNSISRVSQFLKK